MASEVERYIRIQAPALRKGQSQDEWRTLPNGMRVPVWHMSTADAVDEVPAAAPGAKWFIFHINYLDGVTRGCRVTYLGNAFSVVEVSDSTRLRGLELRCVAAP